MILYTKIYNQNIKPVGLATEIGPEVIGLVEQLCSLELSHVEKNDNLRTVPSQVTPNMAHDFSFVKYARLYEDGAPTLWELINNCCRKLDQDKPNLVNDESKGSADDADDYGDDGEGDWDFGLNGAARDLVDVAVPGIDMEAVLHKPCQRRRRNRLTIITSVLSMIAFSRSQWNNSFQVLKTLLNIN